MSLCERAIRKRKRDQKRLELKGDKEWRGERQEGCWSIERKSRNYLQFGQSHRLSTNGSEKRWICIRLETYLGNHDDIGVSAILLGDGDKVPAIARHAEYEFWVHPRDFYRIWWIYDVSRFIPTLPKTQNFTALLQRLSLYKISRIHRARVTTVRYIFRFLF